MNLWLPMTTHTSRHLQLLHLRKKLQGHLPLHTSATTADGRHMTHRIAHRLLSYGLRRSWGKMWSKESWHIPYTLMIFDADYIWLDIYIYIYIYHNLSISLGTRMYRMSKRTWSWKKNMDVLQPVKAFPASKRTNAICHSPPFSHALMAAQQVTSSAHWSLLLVFHWNQGISSPSKYIKTWADVFQSTERVDDSQYKHALHALIFYHPNHSVFLSIFQ